MRRPRSTASVDEWRVRAVPSLASAHAAFCPQDLPVVGADASVRLKMLKVPLSLVDQARSIEYTPTCAAIGEAAHRPVVGGAVASPTSSSSPAARVHSLSRRPVFGVRSRATTSILPKRCLEPLQAPYENLRQRSGNAPDCRDLRVFSSSVRGCKGPSTRERSETICEDPPEGRRKGGPMPQSSPRQGGYCWRAVDERRFAGPLRSIPGQLAAAIRTSCSRVLARPIRGRR